MKFFCHTYYCATGEPLQIFFSFEEAKSYNEAVSKHQERFSLDDFLSRDTEAIPIFKENENLIKELVSFYTENATNGKLSNDITFSLIKDV
jgi:hypothetical protein